MSRPIKVRAWDTNANNWLEGITLTLHCSGNLINVPDNVILTWWTGLKDRNGKDVYEGDIIRAETYRDFKGKQRIDILQVEYVEDVLRPFHEIIVGNEYWCDAFQCEIIGNVYETPELMKVSNQ